MKTRSSTALALLLALPAAAAAQSSESGPATPESAPPTRDELEQRVLELERRLSLLERPPVEASTLPTPRATEGSLVTPPGFWPITGSDFAFKVGGYVKLDVIHDFDAIGNRYKFATQTIAVPGESDSVTTIHARESRLTFDLRGPVGGRDLRVFVEGDFFGPDGTFQLRHAFGTLGGLLAGQTWTTYMDLTSRPFTLDFEGPDGELFVRQPMVRWTQQAEGGRFFSVALEDSSFDVTVDGAASSVGDNPLPDLTANLRLQGAERHLQASGVLRYLDLDAADDTALGWGLALSGKTQLGEPGERLMGQVSYGEGSARYNQATRGTGSDAVLGPGGLDPLPVLTAVAGYEHDWSTTWTSTLALSFASVENSGLQPEDAIHRSESASINLVWHPWPRFLVGGEYLYGRREDRDGADGEAQRLQFSFQFLF